MTREVWASEPMRFGHHDWRVIVDDNASTQYQFRHRWGECWHCHRWWHSYDINDGTFLGLPRSLRRLYDANKETIMAKIKDADSARRALEGGRVIVETRHSEGQTFGLDNGTPVPSKIVKQLQGDLFVQPSEDGLFPGHSQTWRVLD